MTAFRVCILIPTYENPCTVRDVVRRARRYVPDVIVVDDGSGPLGREACAALQRDGLALVHHRARNGGKGAAMKDGLRIAREAGFTHALQIDADGQHAIDEIPRFVAAARAAPEALVLGCPVFDETLHRGRYAARLISRFWNYVEVWGPTIKDSMCGFRVYPIEAALASGTRGDRMNYDIEIPVRMVWQGVPVLNEPVAVRYLTADEGGVSNYRLAEDTVRITWTHIQLVAESAWRLLAWALRRAVWP